MSKALLAFGRKKSSLKRKREKKKKKGWGGRKKESEPSVCVAIWLVTILITHPSII